MEYRVNRVVAIMALAMLSSLNLAAQTVVPGLLPKDARSMGMGGSFKVFAEGYSSLWGNPAGLAARGSLTVADSATWAYVQPTPLNIKNMALPTSLWVRSPFLASSTSRPSETE